MHWIFNSTWHFLKTKQKTGFKRGACGWVGEQCWEFPYKWLTSLSSLSLCVCLFLCLSLSLVLSLCTHKHRLFPWFNAQGTSVPGSQSEKNETETEREAVNLVIPGGMALGPTCSPSTCNCCGTRSFYPTRNLHLYIPHPDPRGSVLTVSGRHALTVSSFPVALWVSHVLDHPSPACIAFPNQHALPGASLLERCRPEVCAPIGFLFPNLYPSMFL